MTSRLVAVCFRAREPERLAAFWGALLDREVTGDGLLPGSATQVGLRFVADDGPVSERFLHLHVTSAGPGDQDRTVARVLELGGRHLDVGQLPEEQHVVVADPEGNPFCVIEAGNNYLAGTGFLGEVACDGPPEVGRFWSEALSWPLVWDQDEETAIQSPAGGTKLAWGGPSDVGKVAEVPNPQWFEVVADAAELERLGATRVDDRTFADPDGNELRLS